MHVRDGAIVAVGPQARRAGRAGDRLPRHDCCRASSTRIGTCGRAALRMVMRARTAGATSRHARARPQCTPRTPTPACASEWPRGCVRHHHRARLVAQLRRPQHADAEIAALRAWAFAAASPMGRAQGLAADKPMNLADLARVQRKGAPTGCSASAPACARRARRRARLHSGRAVPQRVRRGAPARPAGDDPLRPEGPDRSDRRATVCSGPTCCWCIRRA